MSLKTWLGGQIPRNLGKMVEDAKAGRTSRREFLATATALGLTSAAALSLVGTEAIAQTTTSPAKGGVLRVSMAVKEVRDPRLFDWPEMGNIARHFVEPLVRWNSNFTFSPRLLAGWSANADASVYTLKLRTGVKWSNGDDLSVEHIAHNLQRWTEAVPGNSMRDRVGSLEQDGIEIVDATTIRLNLTKPDITIIPGLADYPSLIVHPDFGGDLSANPIGTGPFALEEFELGRKARLVRREEGAWYGETAWGPVHLDAIEYRDFDSNPAGELAAFAGGELDLNFESSARRIGQLDSLGLESAEVLTSATLVARGKQSVAPFDNADFRRGLALAVSNAELLEEGQQGRGTVAENHHVGPMHLEYADLPAKPQKDVAAAKTLFEKSGHANADLTLHFLQGDDYREHTSRALIEQLRAAGLSVTEDGRKASEYWTNWSTFDFSTTNWIARPLGVQILNLAYRSNVGWNETGYANPAFDALLDEANALPDPEDRKVVMAQLQTMLQDDGVIIQPYWLSLTSHRRKAVQGFNMHQSFEHHFEEVWVEEA